MKLSHAILIPIGASTALAETTTKLEARSEMTYAQNWCVAGGAALVGIGTLASGIAALISSASSSSSCTIYTETVEATTRKRATSDAVAPMDVTGFTVALQDSGFNISNNFWVPGNASAVVYPYTISNGDILVHNLTLEEGILSAHLSPHLNSSALEKRYTWDSDEVKVYYHASGKCYTTHGESDIQAVVKTALTHQSTYKRDAACYALSAGGTWTGHLKVLELTTTGYVSTTGYDTACTGSRYVSNTC